MTTSILLVVADGRPGGGTTNVLALAGDLRSAGIAVRLCTQIGSAALEEAVRLGIPADGVDFFRSRLSHKPVSELARLVERHRPSVVHANGNRAAFVAARAQRRNWPPVVYTVRGLHSLRWPTVLGHMLGVQVERWINRRMDATVYVGEEDLATARTHHLFSDNHHALVIRNGVILGDLPTALPQRPCTAAFLGRLHRQKDPLLLADIAAALGPAWTIRIIGSGPLLPDLLRRADVLGVRSQLDLRGELPRSQALEALRDAGMMILPSLWEGLPIAPVEAMGIGVPPIVSRAPGNTEVVIDGVNGLVVGERCAKTWAQAMCRIENEPGLRSRLVAAGKTDAVERFDRRRTTQAYLGLFHELAGA